MEDSKSLRELLAQQTELTHRIITAGDQSGAFKNFSDAQDYFSNVTELILLTQNFEAFITDKVEGVTAYNPQITKEEATKEIIDLFNKIDAKSDSYDLTDRFRNSDIKREIRKDLTENLTDIMVRADLDPKALVALRENLIRDYLEIIDFKAKVEQVNVEIDPNYKNPSTEIGKTQQYQAGAPRLNLGRG